MTAMLEVVIDAGQADGENVVPLDTARASRSGRVGVPTEREIATGLHNGDPGALEAAFRRWADLVHGVARQMVGHSNADDVTQQVFVAAWRSRHSFDPDLGEVPGWLVGITRNVARQHLRRRGPTSVELDDSLDAAEAPAGHDQVIDALLVASALRDLPDEQRTVLELTLLHDLTQVEAAAQLNIPLGTVKTRQRRGLQRLRHRIGGRHDA